MSGSARPETASDDGDSQLPRDGRQSQVAVDIARGAGRCLVNHGFSTVPEVTLANARRADLMGVSEGGDIWIVEIKSSIEDFRSDQKWPEYRDHCDFFFFAVHTGFPREMIPDSVGLILADRYGGEVVRPAPRHKLDAARRKAVLLRYARTAALRLQLFNDPDMGRYIRNWQGVP